MTMLTVPAKYCAQCGAQAFYQQSEKCFVCQDCGFTYFHNVATAVGVFIVCAGKVLFVRRQMEPKKGMLALPGGFVDYRESNEQALRREVMEELQLKIDGPKYLTSCPNTYLYKDVLYHTLDSYFTVQLSLVPELVPELSEISAIEWLEPELVSADSLAFDSLRLSFEYFKRWFQSQGQGSETPS